MKVLALQLKRIGDLVLTAPALLALKQALPDTHITLAASGAAAELLPAIASLDAGVVFGTGRGWTPWQQALTGGFDAVLDFTGTDRSAAATALSRAPRRVTFEWVRKNRVRALAYTDFVTSSVRDSHTVAHYGHLVESLSPSDPGRALTATGSLAIPSRDQEAATALLVGLGMEGPFAIIHPGTARPEKYWLPGRWAEVIENLRRVHGLHCIVTGGSDSFERVHLSEVMSLSAIGEPKCVSVAGEIDLLMLAALIAASSLVVSCDTAAVHLASAFSRPQVALFGPTNPFHWRPLHERAVVLSASQPDEPLTDFTPRMKGAPMERLSTAAVIRATEALLARTHGP